MWKCCGFLWWLVNWCYKLKGVTTTLRVWEAKWNHVTFFAWHPLKRTLSNEIDHSADVDIVYLNRWESGCLCTRDAPTFYPLLWVCLWTNWVPVLVLMFRRALPSWKKHFPPKNCIAFRIFFLAMMLCFLNFAAALGNGVIFFDYFLAYGGAVILCYYPPGD